MKKEKGERESQKWDIAKREKEAEALARVKRCAAFGYISPFLETTKKYETWLY